MNPIQMMAVCGLDCATCEIRRAPTDPDAADVVAWFRRMGWLEENEGISEVIERRMYCMGCREDRSLHWSPECPLLICCVDERGLEHCAQCGKFICEKLEPFVDDENPKYREALERLKQLAEEAPGGGGLARPS